MTALGVWGFSIGLIGLGLLGKIKKSNKLLNFTFAGTMLFLGYLILYEGLPTLANILHKYFV
jgi:hypothetical protein